ncbi:MAG: hypothetical protein K0U52_07585 [Gammaproteobacteria bacterium]|nr:hypothetical protein [Gammaproteobacteria bacterium]
MDQELQHIQEKLERLRAIQWPSACPDSLIGVNVPLALEEGVDVDSIVPDGPPQYNAHGQLCVQKDKLQDAVVTRSTLVDCSRRLATASAQLMRLAVKAGGVDTRVPLAPSGALTSQIKALKKMALTAARLAARAQGLDVANMSCSDLNELFESGDRGLFCGTINKCEMRDDSCVDGEGDEGEDDDEDDDEML